MDSDYLVVDNSIANCVGIIQEEYISRFSPLKECVPLKSEAKSRRLLYQMRKLAKVSVYVVVNAIWYNEQDDVFRIFDYGKVKIDDNDMKERYDGYLRLLSRWLPWGDNEEERQESKEDGED